MFQVFIGVKFETYVCNGLELDNIYTVIISTYKSL